MQLELAENVGTVESSSGPTITAEGWKMRRQTLVVGVMPGGESTEIPILNWEEVSKSQESIGYLLLKRCLDVIGGVFGLVLFSPLIVAAMLLVWLEDGGPALFRQIRVGRHGREFSIFKIRTMVKDAEARFDEVVVLNSHLDHRTFKATKDPRVLQIGKFLRKYSIDEFPQLINVIRGEMSLVGPRPPIPTEVKLYDPQDYVRFVVKPGLTCYWQISGRGTISFKQQVALDRKYVHDASTTVDLAIIAKTLPALIHGVGAH